MYEYTTFTLVITVLNNIFVDTIVAKTVNSTEIYIQDLEQQKDVLYKKINQEIDDTVRDLKEYNHSDALITLNTMKELKKQIKALNETKDVDDASKDIFEGSLTETEKEEQNNQTNFRRHAGVDNSKNSDSKLKLAEIFDLIRKKEKIGRSKANKKEYEGNKKLIQEKIDIWAKQRQEEKDRIREIKEKQKRLNKGLYERCPKEGIGSKKEKGVKLFKKKKGNKRSIYPCCRKCCKRSAMGCL